MQSGCYWRWRSGIYIEIVVVTVPRLELFVWPIHSRANNTRAAEVERCMSYLTRIASGDGVCRDRQKTRGWQLQKMPQAVVALFHPSPMQIEVWMTSEADDRGSIGSGDEI